MSEPGHLHITRAPLQPNDFGYDINIEYRVVNEPATGTTMRFRMQGEINGNVFTEEFELPRDMACNFASNCYHLAQKHGLPKTANIISMHAKYDVMFKDIRQRLDIKSGEAVNPEHLA
ncbi:MAG: DUF5064 family protein [Pseudomonas sp.]